MILALLAILIVGPVMPDHALTPGVTRPLTTQQVCGTKWGKDRRAVTLAMRKQVFAEYRVPYEKHALYEVDHLISRELGGADDIQNLWPQPWTGAWNAYQKDRLENYLHRQVCSGAMTLERAQTAIRGDWRVSFRAAFGDPR